jgi:imidazolonepropionase-like amidohydrolase
MPHLISNQYKDIPGGGIMNSKILARNRETSAGWRLILPAAFIASAVIGLMTGQAIAERPHVYAIKGGKIIVSPGHVIDDGVIILRDGLIQAVGSDVRIPPDAVLVDAAGKTVHAGFLDACSTIGTGEKGGGGQGGRPSAGPGRGAPKQKPGAIHPVASFHPERRILDKLVPDEKIFGKHREMGFTAVLAVPGEGIFRGTSALIALGEGPVRTLVIRAEVAQHVSFERGSFGRPYPTSLMGVMAAIRQGFLDAARQAEWEARYATDPAGMTRPEFVSANASLTRAASGDQPVIFDVEGSNNLLRASRLADEHKLDAIMIGSGTEYEVLAQLKASGRSVILPLSYPDKPKLSDEDAALEVETRELSRYLGAIANPGRLAASGIPFSLATCGMENAGDFLKNLRRAVDEGLSTDDALAALTTVPAKMMGVERSLGTLEAGKAAHLVIQDGDLFSEKTKVTHAFVDGVEFAVESKKSKGDPNAQVDPRGAWTVTMNIMGRTVNRAWTILGTKGDYEGTAETRSGDVEFSSVSLTGNELTVTIPSPRGGGMELTVIIEGEEFEGSGELPGGQTVEVKGSRSSKPDKGARALLKPEPVFQRAGGVS